MPHATDTLRIPAARIDTAGGCYKYILAQFSDQRHYITYTILRSNRTGKYHKDLLDATWRELHTLPSLGNLRCIGGGYITVNKNANTLYLHGTSIAYGPADHSIVSTLLHISYPSYTIHTK